MDNFIITIGREFGAGGRQIANCLAQILNVKVYDRQLLEQIKEKYNLTTDDMDRIRARKHKWWDEFCQFYQQANAWANRPYYQAVFVPTVTSEVIYKEETTILNELAAKESCIILGRTGFHIFKDNKNALKVFLTADMDYRREKVGKRLNISDGDADKLIKKVDEARENFTVTFSGKSRYDARNYDLTINVTNLEPIKVAQMIADCVKQKQNFIAEE